jgi:hypothetical protein
LSIAETFEAPIITQQPITPAFKSTLTNIQVTLYNEIHLNYAEESLELALKTHFQLQQQSHVKKSKKKDVRPLFDGLKITTEGVKEKLKELEKKNKTNKARKQTESCHLKMKKMKKMKNQTKNASNVKKP